MRNPPNAPLFGRATEVRSACFAAVLAGLVLAGVTAPAARAQDAGPGPEGGEVLTRGPVHEAFAGLVSYNPEPGVVVKTPPPELIEEIPPEEKPEGDDVAWIPGYWAWDDERNGYLWISGTWRVPPPGREWMAGYWRDTGDGFQWISGYWADATAQETAYLPPPPPTLEVGANVDAPSEDYGWTPGCWIWREGRYAWRAGYWSEGRADWVWVPAYYVWTPRGVIYVEGFWDYPVAQRGVLFAPIWYSSRGYARRGYSYSPRVVINVSFFNDCLFVRPSYHHYYFGDYYDSRYDRAGFYAAYSFQAGRHGYDPFYSHNRWEHRADRDWAGRYQESYRYRRDHEAARPPHTWSAQVSVSTRSATGGRALIVVASPIDQLARNHDNPGRFSTVPAGDRQRLAQQGREVQQTRDRRRGDETRAPGPDGRAGGPVVEPSRVATPRSPIMAQPGGPRDRHSAPPQTQRAPGGDRRFTPDESERPAPADRRPGNLRQPEPSPSPANEPRPAAIPANNRDDRRYNPEPSPDAGRRNRDRARDAAVPSGDRAMPAAGEPAAMPPPVAERRNVPAGRTPEDTPRRGPEASPRVPRDNEDRPSPAPSRSPDAPRREPEPQARDRSESPRRPIEAAPPLPPAPKVQPPAPRDKPAPDPDDGTKKEK